MTKTEAREILYRELEPVFKMRGYTLKKSKWFGFMRKEENGFTWFYFDFNSYGNKQQLYFVVNKKNNHVEEIYKKVAERFSLTPPISDYTVTLSTNYHDLPKERQNEIGYKIMVDNEADFVEVVSRVRRFFEEEVFETFDRFNDLREMDELIHGKENYWQNSRGRLYSFGDTFYHKAMIIAHHCQSSALPKLFNFEYEGAHYEIKPETDLQALAEKVPGLGPLVYLIELLKEVKPLY